jgi:outer membrane protein OmpA-like peptidoglycan-associated protein
MTRAWRLGAILAAICAFAVLSNPSLSPAGIGDKLKKKATDKADKAADDALKQADAKTTGKDAEGAESPGEAEGANAPAAAGADEKVSAVSTKFDFVPGDKVLFFDDFTQDELGEFPVSWRLKAGTFEVAEREGRRWLRCTSIEGDIRMKLPDVAALPEYWTLELDFLCPEASGNVLTVSGLNGEHMVWNAVFPYSGTSLAFTTGDIFSNTPLEGSEVWGRSHHIMFMARGSAVKVYIDRQRLANVPEIDPAPGAPNTFSFRLWSDKLPMISNVRFAEGNKPVKDPFAAGKLVTYGIYFASGSDVVQPESAPVLRQVAAYLEANAAVQVQITGHTDNQGQPNENLDLSKRRAAAVARVLSDQFKIAADRFKTDGMGDSQAVADNAKAEGRAMNRRVEFTKL